MIRRFLFAAAAAIFTSSLPQHSVASQSTSRVYVAAFPCAADASGKPVVDPGKPNIALFDQRHYGDPGNPPFLEPRIHVTSSSADEVDFYFNVAPGSYSTFLHFPKISQSCGTNGPLITVPGKNRNLFVSAWGGVTDWHSVSAIAGKVPIRGLSVSVLVYDRPMHCGDDVRSYDPKTMKPKFPEVSRATIDDGAYYANFHAYGTQNRAIALDLSGSLFTHGAILLTQTPVTDPKKPLFIEKDITADVLHVAMSHREQLNCLSGF